MKRILCLGYGYTARCFTRVLQADGWRVAGTTRSPEKLNAIAEYDVDPILWNDDGLPENVFDGVNAVLISSGPTFNGCPALAATANALAARAGAISWIGYLSSNGVYGDHSGAWVDEETPPVPTGARGKHRLAAETGWRNFAQTHNAPLVVFRLPGIYGPGRSVFDRLRAGKATRTIKPGQVFSRAHVDDIAAALAASLARPDASALFNIADDEPAPPQDVVTYAAKLLGVEPPPETPLNEATLSPMAKSFWTDNKRVSNARMKDRLGVRLAYPTYREGLQAILDTEQKTAPQNGS